MEPGENIASVPEGFWSTLAVWRFLLALWVLFDHTYNYSPPGHAMPVFTKSGLMAVMCFFVISGFSIHHSIESRPQHYLRRRIWRIMPINTLAVLIAWAAWSSGVSGNYLMPYTNHPNGWHFLGLLFLLQVALPVMVSFMFPAWSLSIEAVCYGLAPYFRRIRNIAVLHGVMAISYVFFLVWPFINANYIAPRNSYEYVAAAMLWVWLAGWLAYQSPRDTRYFKLLLAGGLLSLWTHEKLFAITGIVSFLGNGLPWVGILWAVFYRRGRIPERWSKRADYLGELSFPLYLLHYPVLFVLTNTVLKNHPELNWGLLHVILSLGVAVLAYEYLDKPLRKRFSAPFSGARTHDSALTGAPISATR